MKLRVKAHLVCSISLLATMTLACNQTDFIAIPEPLTKAEPASQDQTPYSQEPTAPSDNGAIDDNETEVVATPIPTTPKPVEPTPETPAPVPETPKPTEPTPETPKPETPKPTEPTPVPVKKYRIIGQGSNRCITAPDSTGVQFDIRDCGSGANQQFTLESVGTNAMKIVTHKGHVMEIRGDNLLDGAVVQTANYANKATQKWKVETKNYSSFEALNVFNSVFTLDALDKGTANGTKIQIWRTDIPTANQRWVIQQI